MDKFNYIIYHHKCIDGFSGFYLFLKTNKWKSKPIVYPDFPFSNKCPPNIDGKNVIVIDVAYKPKIIKQIADKAKKLLFIDHHKTIINDINNLNLKYPHKIVYDVNECGASLVWKYFFKNKKKPLFLKYIRDNDLGIWEFKNTFNLISSIEVNYPRNPDIKTLKKWDDLLIEKNIKKLIEKGRIYNEYKKYIINNTKPIFKYFPSNKFVNKKNSIINKKGKYKVAVVMYGCPDISIVGKTIMEKTNVDFCLIWRYNIKNKLYTISLRSTYIDVGEIAKIFGGGGHKLAAGFSLPKNIDIDDIFV